MRESSCVTKLAKILEEASTHWKTIGIHLGLRECDLPQEDTALLHESFTKVLTYSLQNPPAYPYKRRILFESVKRVKPVLAKKLEKKYNNDEACEYN